MSDRDPTAFTVLIWVLVFAVLLIGGYILLRPHRSHDQQILIDHAKR
jgi:preprotein translocase subunit SecG